MKRILQGFLLITLGLVTGLGLAEIAVRMFAPHSRDHVTPAGLFAIDSALGWKLQPRVSRHHATRYFDVEYAVNALGFRDPPRTVEKADSIRRLLVFGDSQVFGWGIPLGQRFSDVIERHSPNLEVWNMAVPGYGFDQQVVSYLKASDGIPADGAIFYASGATLNRMRSGLLFRKPKPRFTIDAYGRATIVSPVTGSTARTEGLYRALSHFYLPYFLETQVERLNSSRSEREPAAGARREIDSAVMTLAKAALMRAREKAAAKGDELYLIAALPSESSRDLENFARANGITFISTGWTIPPTDLVFGPADRHWIPRLHAGLGKRFAPLLTRQPVPTM
jgi:hypothetical protein